MDSKAASKTHLKHGTTSMPDCSTSPTAVELASSSDDNRQYLLSLHETTIFGNIDLIDVLEKEASNHKEISAIKQVESSCVEKLLLSPLAKHIKILKDEKLASSVEISPIENSIEKNYSHCDMMDESPSSPILCRSIKRMSQKGSSRKFTARKRLIEDVSGPTESPLSCRKDCTPASALNCSSNSQDGNGLLNSQQDLFLEIEKPWEYTVHVPATPQMNSRTSNKCPATPLDSSSPANTNFGPQENFSLKGISNFINSSVFGNVLSPNQCLDGLSLINWDESLHCDGSCDEKSPISLPFCENFHRQLLDNNRKQNARVSVPVSSVDSSNECEDISFFGLPAKVKVLLQKLRGIQDLYDWQKQCLSMPEVLQRQNLVYALPTSGGKTLVAEVLLLKEILVNKKNTIFILPYVSIVQEKVRALSQLAVELDFYVEEYAGAKGSYPPRKRRCKNTVYIATIEKALGLVHSLVMENRLFEVGLVIVDELHLLGEGSRGASLEAVLTKLCFSGESIQMVGMSATIGNLDEIAAFLNAKTFTGDFRPVDLQEYVKCGSTIYLFNRKLVGSEETPLIVHRTLASNVDEKQIRKDPDQIGVLVMEVVPDDSCLIFCPSRKNCENVALLICETMPKWLMQFRYEEKKALFKALLVEGNGSVCAILQKTLPFGVAYHHSGLTTAERRLLEEAYLANTICVICCTSTLAAGVNLPARRVILRSPFIGVEFMDGSRYKQMIGRAGRAGFGGSGESILMCLSQDSKKVLQLLTSSMTESLSSLAEKDGAGMKALVMSSVSLSQTQCRSDIHKLMKCTLLWVQAKKLGVDVIQLADNCVVELVAEGAFCVDKTLSADSPEETDAEIVLAPNPESSEGKKAKSFVSIGLQSKLSLTRLGEAAVKGSLTMSTACQLYADLRRAQEKLVLLNHMHLLHVVTPYNMSDQIKLIPQVFFNVFMGLSNDQLKVVEALGVTEAAAVGLVRGRTNRTVPQAVFDRLNLTLMLNDLWHQKSVWYVSDKYQVSRGQVYTLLTGASAFASSVLRFSEVLEEFWCYKLLLAEITKRLTHCCATELIPLMELPAVKIGRARQLYNAGYRTLRDVAAAVPAQLVREIDHMPRKTAYQIVAAAKLMLIDKAEALREEASDYLLGLSLDIRGHFTP